MYRTRQQFPSFMGVYIPPCSNVQSSINICVCYIATVCAAKTLAIANTDVTALVTGLRGVCRRDSDNLNASHLALVFEERSELIEIPRVASPSERFIAFLGVHTPTDILQVFNGNAFMLFLCLCDELFTYTVVHNGGKSSLTSFQPFQQLMTVASALDWIEALTLLYLLRMFLTSSEDILVPSDKETISVIPISTPRKTSAVSSSSSGMSIV